MIFHYPIEGVRDPSLVLTRTAHLACAQVSAPAARLGTLLLKVPDGELPGAELRVLHRSGWLVRLRVPLSWREPAPEPNEHVEMNVLSIDDARAWSGGLLALWTRARAGDMHSRAQAPQRGT